MIIEKLSSLTVKVSITHEELSRYNTNFENLKNGNANTERLISYIIHEIKENLNINLYSEYIYIEAFSCINNSCVLYISAIDENTDPEGINTVLPELLILETNNIKNMIRFSVEITKYLPTSHKNSSLYYCGSKFRMIMDINPENFESIMDTATTNDLKYCTEEKNIPLTEEYFRCIFENSAIGKLSGELPF